MARPVYSALLYVHQGLTAGSYRVTVPANQIYVLRDADVFEETNAAGSIMSMFGTNANQLWFNTTTASLRNFQWRGRQVIPPLNQFGVFVGSGTWDVAISGYILSAP